MKTLRVSWLPTLLITLCAPAIPVLVRQAAAYDYYSDATAPDGKGNCASCHELPVGGFQRRGALHDAHTNSATGNCQLCHTHSGDIPLLASSGEIGGVGCIGCHGQPIAGQSKAAGLRKHHALKGVPPDQFGLLCTDCHFNDPAPVPESTLPVYYLRSDVIQKSSCNADGKEDFWNRTTGQPDGKGLDNDGDLAYDMLDPDCAVSPCTDRDGDGYGDPGDSRCPRGAARDCDDTRADVYPGAVEAYDQRDNNCNSEIDEIEGDGFNDAVNRMRYTWKSQPPAGQLCDVLRGDGPQFPASSPNSACLVLATPLSYTDDPAGVPLGKAFYYLVRNTLVTDYGKKTDGTLRLYTTCP